MLHNKTIKQLEEKNLASEVEYLSWSDRTDLVALSNAKGEVVLHRLTWTRAWTLAPVVDGAKVRGLTWCPDGKILSVSYNTGDILLINVENKNILHKIEVDGNISCIRWVQEKSVQKTNDSLLRENEEQNGYMKYLDYSSIYLPDPHPLSNFGSNSTEEQIKNNILHGQTELNLLLIGTCEGFVYISIFGCFPCITLNINDYLGYKCCIDDIHVSDTLKNIFITTRNEYNYVQMLIVNCEIFKTHTKELFALAYKYEQLISLVNYLSSTITVIKETWENILLEMDTKLSKYASSVPEGVVTADFLDLLMFGICSNKMEEFLVHDLTKKGLEKFGQTIDMSYANIQKLLLKYITKTGPNITFHLAELRGLACLEHRYKILGLTEDKINDAILSNGSFLIKAGEMQQIINHSIINYKAFVRWLYTAIMNLMDEQIPPEIPKMTQQDLSNITEFLQNFDNIGCKSNSQKSGFIIERLGQYLLDVPLSKPPSLEGNDWSSFLLQNPCIQQHPIILKHYAEMSLVQQLRHLNDAINKIFTQPIEVISNQCTLKCVLNCFSNCDKQLHTTYANFTDHSVFCALLPQKPPADGLYIINFNIESDITARCAYFTIPNVTQSNGNYQVMDIKFYSSKILSLLLQENSLAKTGVLYQFSCASIIEQLKTINLFNEISKQDVPKFLATPLLFKYVDNMTVSKFAVSGCRKVCIVVSDNLRKVRLFEMEAEEEEEDEGDLINNTVRESDVTMHDNSITE